MPPVSMKMAKLQKTTLDPAKISGRCGRLKCCLRYEFDTYRELEQQLPAVGSQVVTSKGEGRVVAQEILAQKLVVEFEDQRRIIIGPDDVLSVEPARSRQTRADERTGPKSGRSHRDGLEDQSLQGIESDHAAWSDDGSIDEAEPETQAEDGNDLGPDRRDRRGG